MASDEDEDIIVTSRISELTLKVNKMLKKPTLDSELTETLDSFMAELSLSDHYLANGIVNIKFAEAGLFLQSSATLYSKKVDLLWDNTLQYQMELCSYNKSAKENVEEANKITQRLNRNKRKKIIHEVVENLPFHENLMNDLNHSNKVLDLCSSLVQNDNLKTIWKETNQNRRTSNSSDNEISSNSDENPDVTSQVQNIPSSDFNFDLNQSVHLDNSDKLGSYREIHSNRLLPYFGSFDNVREPERIIGGNNQDWILMKYLKHRGKVYKNLWLEKLGEDFDYFLKRILQIDELLPTEANAVGLSNLSFVNLTRLPHELMSNYQKDSDVHVRTMIHDLLVKERQIYASRIKKNSERFSEADSAYHEMFNECDSRSASRPDTLFLSQHSNVDSGIFEDQCPNDSFSNPDDDMNIYTNDNLETANENARVEGVELDTSNIGQADQQPLNQIMDNINISLLPEATSSRDMLESLENINKDGVSEKSLNIDTELPESRVNLNVVDNVNADINTEQNNLNRDANCTVDNLNNMSSDQTPTNITVISIIKPVPERPARIVKRKLFVNDDSEDEDQFQKQKRKKSVRFKWLTTTTTSLRKFEKFFLQHYMAEDDEVDENRQVQLEEDSDNESDPVMNRINDEPELGSDDTISIGQAEEVMDVRESDNIDMGDGTSGYHTGFNHDETSAENVTEPIPVNTTCSNITENNVTGTPINNIDIATTSGSINANLYNEQSCSRIKAVNEWRNFIEPKLKALQRNEFDIHEYGTKIISSIPEGEILSFKALVSNEKSSEVCRYFLASLQLANTYNIEFITPKEGLANENLQLKLLSKERYHEHLDEYEAPSENTFREKLAKVKAAFPNQVFHSTPKHSENKKSSRKRLRLSL